MPHRMALLHPRKPFDTDRRISTPLLFWRCCCWGRVVSLCRQPRTRFRPTNCQPPTDTLCHVPPTHPPRMCAALRLALPPLLGLQNKVARVGERLRKLSFAQARARCSAVGVGRVLPAVRLFSWFISRMRSWSGVITFRLGFRLQKRDVLAKEKERPEHQATSAKSKPIRKRAYTCEVWVHLTFRSSLPIRFTSFPVFSPPPPSLAHHCPL
jgi:hypothetical protein